MVEQHRQQIVPETPARLQNAHRVGAATRHPYAPAVEGHTPRKVTHHRHGNHSSVGRINLREPVKSARDPDVAPVKCHIR